MDDAVAIPCDNSGRRANRPVALGQDGYVGLDVDDVLGVVFEMPRAQHQTQARPFDLVGGRGVRVKYRAQPAGQGQEAGGNDDQPAKQRTDASRRRHRIIPEDAADPGMADRREQNETAYEPRRVQRHRQSEDPG